MIEISLVTPTYNERENLPLLAAEINAWGPRPPPLDHPRLGRGPGTYAAAAERYSGGRTLEPSERESE